MTDKEEKEHYKTLFTLLFFLDKDDFIEHIGNHFRIADEKGKNGINAFFGSLYEYVNNVELVKILRDENISLSKKLKEKQEIIDEISAWEGH